ncbi:hypothetical protein [Cellulomonas bogoriensis]|uniref:Membrane protein n=1 Tax=Cellulomonas bogoriensis 69B4 = DSM 16987 TaxID=1386082 RepID=A0A0A0BSL5_9CELL|nr:hypothetical protein [Cellulomonas bogoriensis]KGM10946.1 membrane protein [Cellulomonas bogoriensis 69B4 = DSM 16987]
MSVHGTPRTAPSTPPASASGPGRVLVLVYGLLAVAAGARSAVQILRDLHEAPLAYVLSGVAAAVYVLATVALALDGPRWRPVAWVAVVIELVGVLAVGAISLQVPELFPRATVWSGFGQGYGYVPLVLPVLGILWLRRTSRGGPGGPR